MSCHDLSARWLALPVLLGLVACADDPVAPAPPLTTALTLCTFSDWVAYQNEGSPWRLLGREADGTHSFRATARLGIAIARMELESPYLRVTYLTAAQARELYSCGNPPILSRGTVRGTVLGLSSTYDYAQITYGKAGASASVANPEFTLFPPPGASDLVAIRQVPVDDMTGFRADRVITRYAQSYADGASITLDFSSPEAVPLASSEIRWTGPSAHVQVNYLTDAGGMMLTLQSTIAGSLEAGEQDQRAEVTSIPEPQQGGGGMHELNISSHQRDLALYYRKPLDRTLIFGPPLTAPAFTVIATSPYIRHRAEFPSQPEYGRVAWVWYHQRSTGMAPRASISVTATSEYFGGTPRVWSLSVPDLSDVPGFNPAIGLQPGEYAWYTHATSFPLVFSPTSPENENRIFRSASAHGHSQ